MPLRIALNIRHRGTTLPQSGGAKGALDLPALNEAFIFRERDVRAFSATYARRGILFATATTPVFVSAPSPAFTHFSVIAVKTLTPGFPVSTTDLFLGKYGILVGMTSAALDFYVPVGGTFLFYPTDDDLKGFWVKQSVTAATAAFQHMWWGGQ